MTENARKQGLFTKIENETDASRMVRDAGQAFCLVATLQAGIGLFLAPALLIDAATLMLLAGALMHWRSRAAALLLLLVSWSEAATTIMNRIGVMSNGGQNIILAAIMIVVAARAVEATFRLHGKFSGALRPVH